MKAEHSALGWKLALLPKGSTLQKAIENLDATGLKITLVVNEQNRLLGTLSDGDIRRAILKGYSLGESIDEVVNSSPMVVPPNISSKLVAEIMHANKVQQVPIVDSENRVIGLHVWDAVASPPEIASEMIIMAGGQGVRLRPHTESCPKPMLEVAGKPMLEHIIRHAISDGFRRFVISLGYMGETIEDFFGDGASLGVEIRYLREDSPLGTAGCLSLLDKKIEDPIVVTNGDVMTDVSYSDILAFHLRNDAAATMAVRLHEIQNQFGVVKTNGLYIEGFEEKPVYTSHINAGIYVLSPPSLRLLECNKHCDMPSLFERIRDDGGGVIAYPMHEPWLDVGRPEDWEQAQNLPY